MAEQTSIPIKEKNLEVLKSLEGLYQLRYLSELLLKKTLDVSLEGYHKQINKHIVEINIRIRELIETLAKSEREIKEEKPEERKGFDVGKIEMITITHAKLADGIRTIMEPLPVTLYAEDATVKMIGENADILFRVGAKAIKDIILADVLKLPNYYFKTYGDIEAEIILKNNNEERKEVV